MPARAVVPIVLGITADADLRERLEGVAQRARARALLAPPDGLPGLDPEVITVALIDERIITRRTPGSVCGAPTEGKGR